MAEKKQRKIALACQGGGSHTAFTAGVLKRILLEQDKNFEITAFSGTSGGAICAVLAWYGLLSHGRKKAVELLENFWLENTARTFQDQLLDRIVVCSVGMRDHTPMIVPNPNMYPGWMQEQLKTMLEKFIKFEKIPLLANDTGPMLLIGAVNVMNGKFKIFKNKEITPDAILASAATPVLFSPVHISGETYWDGLFSENPPIRGLAKAKPDEIWVIQINPPVTAKVPMTMNEIRNRRDELTGNLSLEQEIYFIEKINTLIKKKLITGSEYKHIEVKRIQMLRDLDYATKLERSPDFIEGMIEYGEKQAEKFLGVRSGGSEK
ncbi:MAG: Patatin [Desulfobacteraceae bacterium]|nr:Patatin [Desulfobacteraceae bacterium]